MREMTAGELVAAIQAASRPDDVVSLTILDAEGGILTENVMRLDVGHGSDFDRTGGYQWLVITGQAE